MYIRPPHKIHSHENSQHQYQYKKKYTYQCATYIKCCEAHFKSTMLERMQERPKKKKLKENETKQNKNSSKTQNPIISSQST